VWDEPQLNHVVLSLWGLSCVTVIVTNLSVMIMAGLLQLHIVRATYREPDLKSNDSVRYAQNRVHGIIATEEDFNIFWTPFLDRKYVKLLKVFSVGIPLYFVSLAIGSVIKFYMSPWAAWLSLLAPVVAIRVWWHYHSTLLAHILLRPPEIRRAPSPAPPSPDGGRWGGVGGFRGSVNDCRHVLQTGAVSGGGSGGGGGGGEGGGGGGGGGRRNVGSTVRTDGWGGGLDPTDVTEGGRYWYMDGHGRDGVEKQVQVVAINHDVRPPSFVIRVDGREIETEANRLSLHRTADEGEEEEHVPGLSQGTCSFRPGRPPFAARRLAP